MPGGDREDGGEPEIADPNTEAAARDLRADAWFMRRWIEREVARSPADQETLAILLEHARLAKPYKRIAEERGMTPGALSVRIADFKRRYAERYKKRRDRLQMLLLLLVGAVVLVAAIVAWWLGRPTRPRVEPIRPDGPTGTARPAPPPEPFDQAVPTEHGVPVDEGKPRRR
jgi:hypothetical protein